MELIADGANVVLHAATGSGKTLAFLVPLLARLTEGAGLQAVVVAPSQELAVQLAAEAQRLHAEPASVLLALSTDAEGEREQEARLHAPQPRVQLVVGTANRLLALLGRPRAKPLLRDLRTVVLDEVDVALAAAAAAADGAGARRRGARRGGARGRGGRGGRGGGAGVRVVVCGAASTAAGAAAAASRTRRRRRRGGGSRRSGRRRSCSRRSRAGNAGCSS